MSVVHSHLCPGCDWCRPQLPTVYYHYHDPGPLRSPRLSEEDVERIARRVAEILTPADPESEALRCRPDQECR